MPPSSARCALSSWAFPTRSGFFDDAVVHEIRLVINSTDWQSLKDHYLDNTYYPCDFRWQGQVVRNVGIRSRGTGSRSGVKPGLRVDFNRYTTNQQFLGLKSVILRNNTQDPSNLHERLSMLLFRRMGLPASREAYTTLYVNNEYVGLYTIVESSRQDIPEADVRRGWRVPVRVTTIQSTPSRTTSSTEGRIRICTSRSPSSPRRTKPIRGQTSSSD